MGDCPKMVAWAVCRFKGEGFSEQERRGVFLKGVDTPNAHYVKEKKINGKNFYDL